MSVFAEYKSTTKGVPLDELADLVFYRPLSYALVKLCTLFPITPNQISFLAMMVGIVSGIFFGLGTQEGFIMGGLLCSAANILDCTDGMLARLKSKGTLTGRIIDGVAGHILMVAVYTGFGIGLERAVHNDLVSLPFHPLLLVGLAGVGHLVQAALSDHYACLYATHVLGQDLRPQSEIAVFSRELERLKPAKDKALDRLMIRLYLAYTKIQLGANHKAAVRYDPEEYRKHNQTLVMLWNLVGPSMHIFVLLVASIFFKPMVFIWYAVIIGTIWILLLYPIQAAVNKKMARLPCLARN
jgi:CDP-alcohol phosphatidyltransferase